MNEQLPTTKEVLVVVNDLSVKMDNKFEDVLGAITAFAEDVQIKFVAIDERFNRIESQMVTKDYLDKKISEVRGDFVFNDRKIDNKVDAFVMKLFEKDILNEDESKEIVSMSPFPKLK